MGLRQRLIRLEHVTTGPVESLARRQRGPSQPATCETNEPCRRGGMHCSPLETASNEAALDRKTSVVPTKKTTTLCQSLYPDRHHYQSASRSDHIDLRGYAGVAVASNRSSTQRPTPRPYPRGSREVIVSRGLAVARMRWRRVFGWRYGFARSGRSVIRILHVESFFVLPIQPPGLITRLRRCSGLRLRHRHAPARTA